MKRSWIAFITASVVTVIATIASLHPAMAADKYVNYADLAAHEREGADYQISVGDTGASRTVLAIHGGWIERGTSELARAVATQVGPEGQSAWNLYLFEADRTALHLTSTHFDEPRALTLVGRSERVLSLHGFYQGEDRASIACVGGGDVAGAEALASALRAHATELAITVEYPCARFGGSDPLNIVNRGLRAGGVQLELSRPLRERLRADTGLTRGLAAVLAQ